MKFPNLKVHVFVQGRRSLGKPCESEARRGDRQPARRQCAAVSLASERIGTKPIRVLASKSTGIKQPATLKELSATPG